MVEWQNRPLESMYPVADFTLVPPGETSGIRFGDSEALLEAPVFNEVLGPAGDQVRVIASY